VPIKMTCPSCGKTLAAPDTAAGKKAKCPSCGQIMVVPEAVHEAEDLNTTGAEPAEAGSYSLDEILGAESTAGSTTPAQDDRRPCPMCGEMIIATAAKCRFCGAIFDARLKQAAKKKYGPNDETLTAGDWVFCILCGGIACIFGIVYAIQGKPKGIKMVGISLVASFVWGIIRVILEAAMSNVHR
jgi:predicted RNA-binding Zn-ribbon protein involved in translation (DUF1610 family)